MTVFRALKTILAAMLVSTLSMLAWAQPVDLPPIIIADEDMTVSGAYVASMPEPDAFELIANKLDRANQIWDRRDQFTPFMAEEIDFGFLTRPVWLTFDVRNTADVPQDAVISLGRPELRVAEIYVLEDGQLRTLHDRQTDQRRRLRLRRYLAIAEQDRFEAGETRSYLVRFQSSHASLVNLTIGTDDALRQAIDWRLFLLTCCAMGSLMLVIFNSVFIGFFRKHRLLWFPLAQFLTLLNALQINGMSYMFFASADRLLMRLVDHVLTLGSMLLLLQFARVFLHTAEKFPVTDTWLRWILRAGWGVLALAAVCHFTGITSPENFIGLVLPIWFVSMVMLVIVSYRAARHGQSEAWPVFWSWAILGALVTYMMIEAMTPLPSLPEQELFLAFITLLEAGLITLALGLYAKRVNDEKITAQSKLNTALRSEIIALQDAADKNNLLRSVGHDGGNMLSALNFLSSDIQNADTLDAAKQSAAKLEGVSGMLSEILQIMIDSAASDEAGKGPVAFETIDLETLLTTVKMVNDPRARETGLRIKVLSNVQTIAADRVRLFRILNNLVSNAVKYAERGRVLILCRRAGDTVRFQVMDQGVGMDADAVTRLSNGGTSQVRYTQMAEGTGIGVAICREFAEDMGGHISIQSAPGKGSVIELVLPAPLLQGQHKPQIGILGEAADWPHLAEPFDLVPATGSAGKELPPLLVDDLVSGPGDLNPQLLNNGRAVILATFDKSSSNRSVWDGKVRAILYKPIGPEAVLAVLQHLQRLRTVGQPKGDQHEARIGH